VNENNEEQKGVLESGQENENSKTSQPAEMGDEQAKFLG
jgi:hypothetical protein